MEHAILLVILGAYCVSQYVVGRVIVRYLSDRLPYIFEIVGSLLVGAGVSVPVTYALSLAFVHTGDSLLKAVISYIVLSVFFSVIKFRISDKKKHVPLLHIDYSFILFIIFSLSFSVWLMTKTFHGGSAGELFVGGNNVFDFGHALGIVRSFSWGANIPFTSPFRAGLPFFYHFFFLFWVGLLEYFGIPIIWAMNIPSILSFFMFLICLYYLPQLLAKQGKIAGWVTVILTITHSTLTFWHVLAEKGLNPELFRYVWRLPGYPYAGPFDGSVISIFMTLNNYVNQRHLAFSVALGLFLIIGVMKSSEQRKLLHQKIVIYGALTGILFLWNMAICAVVGAVIVLFLGFAKKWKELLIFISVSSIGVCLSILPYLSKWDDVLILLRAVTLPVGLKAAGVTGHPDMLRYFWENLGILPIVAAFGFIVIPRTYTRFILPFLFLFIAECIYAAAGYRGFDQKFLSFLIIGVNIVAAVGIVWLWQQKKKLLRMAALCIFSVLVVSGLVDLMVIKNEFAFPLVDTQSAHLISWIRGNTPKKSVFVSYSDMIDPVVLAGRKNYFGFFRNVDLRDRSYEVSRIYLGDDKVARSAGISYILVPKGRKNDFPYAVREDMLRSTSSPVFDTERYLILKVNRGMLK